MDKNACVQSRTYATRRNTRLSHFHLRGLAISSLRWHLDLIGDPENRQNSGESNLRSVVGLGRINPRRLASFSRRYRAPFRPLVYDIRWPKLVEIIPILIGGLNTLIADRYFIFTVNITMKVSWRSKSVSKVLIANCERSLPCDVS